jgi:histone deacetylase 1/2
MWKQDVKRALGGPKDHKSVGCKWVFRIKKDAWSEIVRYKAWLVAKGCSQVARMDFNKSFAPVAKFITMSISQSSTSLNTPW